MEKDKELKFYKYQGAGNDFVLFNQLNHQFELTKDEIVKICDRRFGIGADGLMYLRNSEIADFNMIYFNSDGNLSTMCGNGGRCISRLFFQITNTSSCTFEAIDGMHKAELNDEGHIALLMSDVIAPHEVRDNIILDTGSPHYVKVVEDVNKVDVQSNGSKIRYSREFEGEGINVNFLQYIDRKTIAVRTYERGVERETLSCGTGVTACALASHLMKGNVLQQNSITIKTRGGNLMVKYRFSNNTFKDIWLIGPAIEVFAGTIRI